MPRDTDQMKYNNYHHLYVLTLEHAKNGYDYDFIAEEGSETKAKNRLLRISNRLYDYIYNHKRRNKNIWEWFLAFDEEVRPVIQRALEWQMQFEYESNASSLQNQLGVNLLNGVVIPLKDLRGDRGISLDAINELKNFRDGMLVYTGKEMYIPIQATFDYEEMGY